MTTKARILVVGFSIVVITAIVVYVTGLAKDVTINKTLANTTIQINGCGIRSQYNLKNGEGVRLAVLLGKIARPSVDPDGVIIKTPGNPGSLTYFTWMQATNGKFGGMLIIYGTNQICLVHSVTNQ